MFPRGSTGRCQTERFGGLHAGLFGKTLAATADGFEHMKAAFKNRAEGG